MEIKINQMNKMYTQTHPQPHPTPTSNNIIKFRIELEIFSGIALSWYIHRF